MALQSTPYYLLSLKCLFSEYSLSLVLWEISQTFFYELLLLLFICHYTLFDFNPNPLNLIVAIMRSGKCEEFLWVFLCSRLCHDWIRNTMSSHVSKHTRCHLQLWLLPLGVFSKFQSCIWIFSEDQKSFIFKYLHIGNLVTITNRTGQSTMLYNLLKYFQKQNL